MKAVFYKKIDGTAGSSNLATTDASGNATITYSSNIDYGYIFIQPLASDQTHAIGVIQNIQGLSNANLNFTLKPAELFFKILNSDDTDAAIGAELSLGGTFFQTLRTGAFGLSKSDLVLNIKSNAIYLGPGTGITNQIQNAYYLSANKTDTGMNYKLYSDAAKANEVAPVSGVYQVKFRPHGVKVTIKNSNGSSFTLPSDVPMYGEVNRVDVNEEQIWERFSDSWNALVGSDGVWYGGLGVAGKYPLSFRPTGTDLIPSFLYGNLWSNGSGLVSSTSADSGFPSAGQALNLEVTLPATFLAINYKDRDSGDLIPFSANLSKKIGATYSG